MKLGRSTQAWALLVLTLLLAVLGIMIGVSSKVEVGFIRMYQDVRLTFMPSAEAAYRYGNMYLDATKPEWYDKNRAKTLYDYALAYNEKLPLVRHQLARIAFLNSQFDEGLRLIDDEIAMLGDAADPSSYYVRGLIKGFMGDYNGAAEDYKVYIESDAKNWAAVNDLAWVLLRAGRHTEALDAINAVIEKWPDNAWLLNNRAIAYYELGFYDEALKDAEKAHELVARVTQEEWLLYYPGNDPLIAPEGVAAFREAVDKNLQKIASAQGTR